MEMRTCSEAYSACMYTCRTCHGVQSTQVSSLAMADVWRLLVSLLQVACYAVYSFDAIFVFLLLLITADSQTKMEVAAKRTRGMRRDGQTPY